MIRFNRGYKEITDLILHEKYKLKKYNNIFIRIEECTWNGVVQDEAKEAPYKHAGCQKYLQHLV